jgi:hypothetical protein
MKLLLVVVSLFSSFFIPSELAKRISLHQSSSQVRLYLPEGFKSVVVVDSLPGSARHLAVNNNGDIYVKGRRELPGGMNWALRDTNGDGRADVIQNFGTFHLNITNGL